MKLNALFLLIWLGVINAYDYSWKPCWRLPIKNESFFCNEAVTWNISESTYKNAWEKDLRARADYEILLAKWKKAETDSPSSDCLAIA